MVSVDVFEVNYTERVDVARPIHISSSVGAEYFIQSWFSL